MFLLVFISYNYFLPALIVDMSLCKWFFNFIGVFTQLKNYNAIILVYYIFCQHSVSKLYAFKNLSSGSDLSSNVIYKISKFQSSNFIKEALVITMF